MSDLVSICEALVKVQKSSKNNNSKNKSSKNVSVKASTKKTVVSAEDNSSAEEKKLCQQVEKEQEKLSKLMSKYLDDIKKQIDEVDELVDMYDDDFPGASSGDVTRAYIAFDQMRNDLYHFTREFAIGSWGLGKKDLEILLSAFKGVIKDFEALAKSGSDAVFDVGSFIGSNDYDQISYMYSRYGG